MSNQARWPGGAPSRPSLASKSSPPSAAAEADPRQRVDDEAPAVGALQAVVPATRLVAVHHLQEARQVRSGEQGLHLGRQRQGLRRVPGRHHAGMHAQPALVHQRQRRVRSQSSQASRSGASRMPSSVSLRCGRRTPCATASRCRSWLPSRQLAAPPSARSALQHRQRLRPAVDQVAQQHGVVARRRKADLVEQALERAVAALHVADQVVHGADCAGPPGAPLLTCRLSKQHPRRGAGALHGRGATGVPDPAQWRIRHGGDGPDSGTQGAGCRCWSRPATVGRRRR